MPSHDLPGARIHYRIAGSEGPAFVFVHGGCCSLADWRLQFAALEQHATVLALDLRGHGGSTGDVADCTVARWAEDVNALIDALRIGPAVIVGHSLGARIAAEAAWQAPANAAALVLVDGSRSVGGLAAAAPVAGSRPAAPADGDLAAILDATVGPYADAETRRAIIATMTTAPMTLMLRTVAAYSAWDEERADAVVGALSGRLPVLAIQSTYHDRFTPRHALADQAATTPYLDWLKAALPQLEIAILPNTGHFSMLERPGVVTGLLRQFAAATTELAP